MKRVINFLGDLVRFLLVPGADFPWRPSLPDSLLEGLRSLLLPPEFQKLVEQTNTLGDTALHQAGLDGLTSTASPGVASAPGLGDPAAAGAWPDAGSQPWMGGGWDPGVAGGGFDHGMTGGGFHHGMTGGGFDPGMAGGGFDHGMTGLP